MATYTELRNLFGTGDLRNRTEVAVVVAANDIAQNSSAETAERLTWARNALGNPGPEADKALLVALAVNKDLTVAQIQGASDTALQNNVDSAVNVLVVGSTG